MYVTTSEKLFFLMMRKELVFLFLIRKIKKGRECHTLLFRWSGSSSAAPLERERFLVIQAGGPPANCAPSPKAYETMWFASGRDEWEWRPPGRTFSPARGPCAGSAPISSSIVATAKTLIEQPTVRLRPWRTACLTNTHRVGERGGYWRGWRPGCCYYICKPCLSMGNGLIRQYVIHTPSLF